MRTTFLFLLIASWSVVVNAWPVDVLPVRTAEGAQFLNGVWKFKYVPALEAGADEGFHAPRFDVAAWKTIPVPSHWELQGFTEPQYADEVKEDLGLYRRTFRLSKQ